MQLGSLRWWCSLSWSNNTAPFKDNEFKTDRQWTPPCSSWVKSTPSQPSTARSHEWSILFSFCIRCIHFSQPEDRRKRNECFWPLMTGRIHSAKRLVFRFVLHVFLLKSWPCFASCSLSCHHMVGLTTPCWYRFSIFVFTRIILTQHSV